MVLSLAVFFAFIAFALFVTELWGRWAGARHRIADEARMKAAGRVY